jgi:hypothetical protein
VPEPVKQVKFRKGRIFGSLEFSPGLVESKSRLMNKRGILGYLNFRNWIRGHEGSINRILLHFEGKERHLIDALSILRPESKGRFLLSLERLVESEQQRGLGIRFVEAIGQNGFDGFTAERLSNMLNMAKENVVLSSAYAQVFDVMLKYKGRRVGSGILSYFEFLEQMFSKNIKFPEVKDVKSALEINKILFDLIMQSSSEIFLKKGSNFLWMVLRLARENRFRELFDILRKVKNLADYSIVFNKLNEETIRLNYENIILILQKPNEQEKLDSIIALIKK